MDRGAWQASVHGISKSWTWLNTAAHIVCKVFLHLLTNSENPERLILLTPLHWWENWDNWSRVTQLICGRTRIWIQVCLAPNTWAFCAISQRSAIQDSGYDLFFLGYLLSTPSPTPHHWARIFRFFPPKRFLDLPGDLDSAPKASPAALPPPPRIQLGNILRTWRSVSESPLLCSSLQSGSSVVISPFPRALSPSESSRPRACFLSLRPS